jgi:hypothetical protein
MISWYSGDSSGAPAADVFGVNSGSAGTGVATASGVLASAQSFPGTVGAFDAIADSASLDTIPTAKAVTMEAWIQATALGGRIFDKITAGGTNGYLLDTVGGKLRIIAGSGTVSSTASLKTGEWIHVAGVYDGATLTVYANATPVGTLPYTGALPGNTLPLRLGADSQGANRFDGSIDEARIYNRALSAADIQALYDEAACQ